MAGCQTCGLHFDYGGRLYTIEVYSISTQQVAGDKFDYTSI